MTQKLPKLGVIVDNFFTEEVINILRDSVSSESNTMPANYLFTREQNREVYEISLRANIYITRVMKHFDALDLSRTIIYEAIRKEIKKRKEKMRKADI